MGLKPLSGYLLILFVSFAVYLMKSLNIFFNTLLPIIMLLFPLIIGHKVKIRLSLKDLSMGLVISIVVLLPYYFISGGDINKISIYYFFSQLFLVALPEEFFFRGFLQDSLGKNFKAVLLTSLLFSFAHLPKAMFANEWLSLLSFFPSIIMGWLYMETNNILPGTIFHFLANLVYMS